MYNIFLLWWDLKKKRIPGATAGRTVGDVGEEVICELNKLEKSGARGRI